jgi:membrane-bound lytic murein transglycosylase B
MIRPRRRLRRALLSALAGSGLTAVGLGGPLSGALGAETVTTSTTETPPATSAPTTSAETTSTETTPPPTTTSTQATPPVRTITASTPPPAQPAATTPAVSVPVVKKQHKQKATIGEAAITVTKSQSQPETQGAASAKTTGPSTAAAGSGNVAPAPQIVAGQAGALSALLAGSAASELALENFQVPLFLLPIYQAAAIQYGVPWEVLAAINEVETDYGTDLNVSSAGAVGWMQFMPETWLQYGVDAVDAGYADPYNPVDAIFAAGRYLRAAGAATDLRDAIFSYNHSDAYVSSVLLRARLLASYPQSVIATLTGLTEGSLPIPGAQLPAGPATPESASSSSSNATAAASRVAPGTQNAPSPAQSASGTAEPEQFIDIDGSDRAAVIAVEDGRVMAIGDSRKLGRYLTLRDVYGDEFTYAGLGDVAARYRLPKTESSSAPKSAKDAAETSDEGKPKLPASAGSHPAKAAAEQTEEATATQSSVPSTGKVRLFAHPDNPYALAAAARREEASLKGGRWVALRRGSVLTQGTVLGHLGVHSSQQSAQLRFAIRPAGDRGTVDPLPILENWRELGSALHPRGSKGSRGLIGATANDVFLLSKSELERAVLAEPGIDIYQCGRRDIASGAVSDHILAALLFLSRSGLKPTVQALRCGQNKFTASGAITSYYHGDAVDISAVNGVQIANHQGADTITDLTIRTLLTLQGRFAPNKIISLMKYPGAPSTIARADHGNFVEIEFLPSISALAPNPKLTAKVAHTAAQRSAPSPVGLQTQLSAAQWQRLIQRIGGLPMPKVPSKPSSAAIRDPQAPKSNNELGTAGLPLTKR